MNTPLNSDVEQPAEDVYGWVKNDSSVMFKAVTKHGDPVELTASEARDVAASLLKLATKLESVG